MGLLTPTDYRLMIAQELGLPPVLFLYSEVAGIAPGGFIFGGDGRIRACDLRVVSPTDYRDA